jgi:hypothetical protein
MQAWRRCEARSGLWTCGCHTPGDRAARPAAGPPQRPRGASAPAQRKDPELPHAPHAHRRVAGRKLCLVSTPCRDGFSEGSAGWRANLPLPGLLRPIMADGEPVLPGPSRLKSSSTFVSRTCRPSARRSAMKSVDRVTFGASPCLELSLPILLGRSRFRSPLNAGDDLSPARGSALLFSTARGGARLLPVPNGESCGRRARGGAWTPRIGV